MTRLLHALSDQDIATACKACAWAAAMAKATILELL